MSNRLAGDAGHAAADASDSTAGHLAEPRVSGPRPAAAATPGDASACPRRSTSQPPVQQASSAGHGVGVGRPARCSGRRRPPSTVRRASRQAGDQPGLLQQSTIGGTLAVDRRRCRPRRARPPASSSSSVARSPRPNSARPAASACGSCSAPVHERRQLLGQRPLRLPGRGPLDGSRARAPRSPRAGRSENSAATRRRRRRRR